MGLLFSRLHQAIMYFYGTNARIVMVGLDAVGKTTILYHLKLNQPVSTIPSVGFNVETIEPISNVTFTVWDLSSQIMIRPLWRHYFPNTDGLVFVVDCSDLERFQEAQEELQRVLQDCELHGVPLLVMANKQDVVDAMKPDELVDKLGLRNLKGRQYHVQGCCATTGDGLVEGFEILANFVKDFKNGTPYLADSDNVQTDLKYI